MKSNLASLPSLGWVALLNCEPADTFHHPSPHPEQIVTRLFFISLLILSTILYPVASAHAQGATPVVHAVLFYSPTCGHCEFVITQTILPMMDEYGSQLQVIGVDVTTEDGNALFMSALKTFNVERAGVPFLVIDNTYLIGSADIPEQFPSLVDSYLEQGGVDYPNIPGLAEALDQPSAETTPPAQSQPQITEEAAPSTSMPTAMAPNIQPVESHDINWRDRFAQDPTGNSLSVIVLLGMLAALGWVAAFFKNTKPASSKPTPAWLIPLLCVIGFGVAGYLAYVETTQTSAICGPVGDCNTVQQSDYARLFGILPIGVLGLVGYTAIFISWLIAGYGNKKTARLASLAIFLLTLSGTIFSVYLTFLEPFVIGATCAWCLTSAILMTGLLLVTTSPAKTAINQIRAKANR